MSENKHGPNEPAGGGAELPAYRMRPMAAPGLEGLQPGMKYKAGVDSSKTGDKDWEVAAHEHSRPVWLVLGGMATVVLLVSVAFVKLKPRQADGLSTGVQTEAVREKAFDPGKAKDWKGLVPVQIAESFTQATTHEERLKWLRDPERAAPSMEDFFRDGPGANEKILGITPMKPASNGRLAFQRFQVLLENGGSRLLCVVLTEDGGKVDFECYARHGSATWKDLLGGKASEAAEVRVLVEPGFAYVYGYSDEKKWSSYVATTPDLEDPMNFYALRGSKADKALRAMTGGGPVRATLAIRSVENRHATRQFEVTEVHTQGWVR